MQLSGHAIYGWCWKLKLAQGLLPEVHGRLILVRRTNIERAGMRELERLFDLPVQMGRTLHDEVEATYRLAGWAILGNDDYQSQQPA